MQTDLVTALDRLAPFNAGWVHDTEGPDDMPAHVKSMINGVSLHVPVSAASSRSEPGRASISPSIAAGRIAARSCCNSSAAGADSTRCAPDAVTVRFTGGKRASAVSCAQRNKKSHSPIPHHYASVDCQFPAKRAF